MGLRQDRLADEIRDLIAVQFMGDQMSDPRLKNVSITAVKLTADLQLASVYYRVVGDDKAIADAQKGLHSASGFLRHRLAEALEIRRIPALRFFHDESVERGSRIESLLSQL
jgi:ribosome-binding factor A